MDNRCVYETKIFNLGRYSLAILIGYFSVLALLFVSLGLLPLYMTAARTSVVFGWLLLFILPFLFMRRIKETFTSKALLVFDDDHFHVITYQKDDETEGSHDVFEWAEVKSYSISLSKAITTLILFPASGDKKKTFYFLDKADEEEALEDDSVASLLLKSVNGFNARTTGKKIKVNSSLKRMIGNNTKVSNL